MSLEKYATPLERKIVEKLVDDMLAAGYFVHVNDGSETTLPSSKDRSAILGAMATTEEDYLMFGNDFFLRDGKLVPVMRGWVQLIWGNGPGELFSNWTDNDATDAVVAGANAIGEAEAG